MLFEPILRFIITVIYFFIRNKKKISIKYFIGNFLTITVMPHFDCRKSVKKELKQNVIVFIVISFQRGELLK